ncbi:MAG TPA: toll/interleukin-1 receptor domain-containing protein [Anaerolineales bacterium]|nr:toll/interleukin-1 receptor domain-containing protein [Anaerolineales bacterium]
MIDITFQPTQLVIDQINSLSIKLTNAGDKLYTHVYFRVQLPPQIVLLEGKDKIEDGKIDPGQNILLTVGVRPKQVGSWIIGSSSFSYRDSQGQPHHPTPLQQEIIVIPMVTIPKSQSDHINDRAMVGDPSALNHSTLSPEDITYPPKTIRPLSSNEYEKEVFISYAWGGESERTVDELDQAFADHGIRIIRDKKELEYKGSIETFEQRIGQGKCIVLVISDKFLRSEHCMYELVQVDENRNLRQRIFPIVLADARIYKALDRLTYIKYWDEQIEQLNRAIKEIGIMTNLASITTDLDKYARIRSNIDHLTDLLSDMNVLTPELHAVHGFSTLIRAVERSLV